MDDYRELAKMIGDRGGGTSKSSSSSSNSDASSSGSGMLKGTLGAEGVGEELNSLPFGAMLANPLQAIITAQGQCSMHTIAFIKMVGFKSVIPQTILNQAQGAGMGAFNFSFSEPLMVDFEMEKLHTSGKKKTLRLNVPFLALIPLPILRITSAEVSFNCRIVSQESWNHEDSYSRTKEVGSKVSMPWGGSSSRTTHTTKKNTKESKEFTQDFNLNVSLKLSNNDNPVGVMRLIDLLESLIKQKESQQDRNEDDLKEEAEKQQ
mmetsp:Transcript_53306/g.133821  ORF Transcript_53306/g.133821 Transcript_53306/m.133821 type:complete len:263 (+) Transcript_53306:201-989(+)